VQEAASRADLGSTDQRRSPHRGGLVTSVCAPLRLDRCRGEWQALDPESWPAPTRMARLRAEETGEMDVGNLLTKVSDSLSVRRAFGTAYEKDDMLIIPVAVVAGGGGAGTGHPRHRAAAGAGHRPEGEPAGQGATPPDTDRADAGGGFGGLVVPMGAYVVKGGQVRWVSAVDITIAMLASLSLVRMLSRTWTRSRLKD
jgi:uncharacterized spore protein YtfJ